MLQMETVLNCSSFLGGHKNFLTFVNLWAQGTMIPCNQKGIIRPRFVALFLHAFMVTTSLAIESAIFRISAFEKDPASHCAAFPSRSGWPCLSKSKATRDPMSAWDWLPSEIRCRVLLIKDRRTPSANPPSLIPWPEPRPEKAKASKHHLSAEQKREIGPSYSTPILLIKVVTWPSLLICKKTSENIFRPKAS